MRARSSLESSYKNCRYFFFLTRGIAYRNRNIVLERRQKHRDEDAAFDFAEKRRRFPLCVSLSLIVSVSSEHDAASLRVGPFPRALSAYPLGATGEILLAWKELSGISSGRRGIRDPLVATGGMFPRSITPREYLALQLLRRLFDETNSYLFTIFFSQIYIVK